MPVMPDSRIPLGAVSDQPQQSGGAGGSFLGTLGSMMKIKEGHMALQQKQMELAQARRDEEDELAVRDTVQRYERPEDAVDELYKAGRVTAAYKLAKGIYDQHKAKLEEYDAGVKSVGTAMGLATNALAGVTDQASWEATKPAILKYITPLYGDHAADMLPTTYTPDAIKGLSEAGKTVTQRMEAESARANRQIAAFTAGMEPGAEQDVIDPKTGKPTGEKRPGMWSPNGINAHNLFQENLARDLKDKPKSEWPRILDQHWRSATPQVVIEKFLSQMSPEEAGQLGMTLPQQATAATGAANAAANQTRADTAAAAAKAKADAAGQPKPLTHAEYRQIEESEDTENKRLEKDVRTVWEKEQEKKPRVRRADLPKDPKTGKAIEPPPAAFSLDDVPKPEREKFGDDKINNKNQARTRQGLPTMEDEARAAAKAGNVEKYTELYNIYSKISAGVRDLSDTVPPPAGFKGDADRAKAKKALELADKIKETTDATKKRALQDELNALVGRK